MAIRKKQNDSRKPASEKGKTKKPISLFRRIVNIFLFIGIALLVLLLLAFGFSQTKTFRNLLKENIESAVNGSINGQLKIKEIRGTIFTSLSIIDPVLLTQGDTLFHSDKIEVNTILTQLLFKNIFLKKVELDRAKIKILQDSDGVWSIEKLAKSGSGSVEEKPDSPEESEGGAFPFNIQVNYLQIKDLEFIRKNFDTREKEYTYSYLNFDDFHIQKANLVLRAAMSPAKSTYKLLLQKLDGKTNIDKFTLKNLSGHFEISPSGADVKFLRLQTERTDLTIKAKLDSLNLFGDVDLANFETWPTEISLAAKPFHFNDLSVFLRDVDFLKGPVDLDLTAEGSFGNLDIKNLDLNYLTTGIKGSGNVKNLHTPEDLFININLVNSTLDYSTLNKLMPELQLSEYPGLIIKDASIDFRGKPLNFAADFKGNIKDGRLEFKSLLNFEREEITYDVNYRTFNLNLMSILGTQTRINAKGKLKGKGTDPAKISAGLDTEIKNSIYNGYKIGNIKLAANSISKNIDLNIEGDINGSGFLVSGNLNLSEEDNPVYDLTGTLKNLNLESFIGDSLYSSSLNFDFSANGQKLDLDKTVGTFVVVLDTSEYIGKEIKGAELQLDVSLDGDFRLIELTSDFLDFSMEGEFKLTEAISLLQYQSEMISNSFSAKASEITAFSKGVDVVDISLPAPGIDFENIQNKNLDFKFDFKFKDFSLISTLLQNDKLNIDGIGSGKVKNDANNFTFNTSVDIDQFVNSVETDVIYLAGSEISINFTRDNKSNTFDNLFGAVSITGDRLFFGSNIENFSADIIFNQDKLFYNFSSMYEENLKLESDGDIVLSGLSDYRLNMNKVSFEYDKLLWSNRDPIIMNVTPDSINLENFNLSIEDALLTADGSWKKNSDIDFKMHSSNFPGTVLSYYLLQSKEKFLDAEIDLDCNISGTTKEPIIDFIIDVRNMGSGTSNFGNLFCKFFYSDKKLITDIQFINPKMDIKKPILTIDGYIPIDLAFGTVEKRMIESDTIDFNLKSSNFKLSTLGNTLPFVTNQRGDLNADVELKGTLDNLDLDGKLTIFNGFFRARDNNLDYSLDARLSFNDEIISIDTVKISNKGGSRYGGNMYFTGNIGLEGLSLANIDMNIEGDIALLGSSSRAVSSQLYGDLFIASEGVWKYTYAAGKSLFNGSILLKETDITYAQQQNVYKQSANNIVYKFVVDSSKLDQETVQFEQILEAAKLREAERLLTSPDESNFDYQIDIKAENVARAVFILSPAVNQRLVVEVFGDLKFSSRSGEQRAQGAFTLLSGSKLEFFKTFDATGTIRFESDVTDPYLDIVASYVSDYISPDNTSSNQQVAVKLFLKGPLSQLGKNLATDPENIAVYVGSRNIQNNIPDPRYDAADALSFILIGKFKNDLTSSDKNQVASQTGALESTATSFLGPVLTTFVNSAVGDIVNDIQLSQTGEYTKFNVSGKYQKFRYSFGGTTELFQNIYKANLKIEYLINQNFSIRAERKDPIVQSYGFEEKINELGLKYKFDF